jgi:hypothetical protein
VLVQKTYAVKRHIHIQVGVRETPSTKKKIDVVEERGYLLTDEDASKVLQ